MANIDEIIRKAEIRQVRKMVREIRKNGDAAISHYLEAAVNDHQVEMLEDALDFSGANGHAIICA
jgi:hypothetical protein